MSLSFCVLAFVPAQQALPLDGGDRAFPRFGEPIEIEIGDLDGDSDVDAVVAASEGVFLVSQLFPGSFEQPGRMLADTAFPLHLGKIALFDADGDADLDLFLGRYTVPTRLLLNDGKGAFVDGDALLPAGVPDSFNPRVVSAGDLDLDGDEDLLFVSHNIARMWRNDGAAGFSDRVLGPLVATEQALADVDGDGDLDRFSATAGNCEFPPPCISGSIALSLNNGSGAFAAASFPTTELAAGQLAVGDVDQDGDLDLVAASLVPSWPTRLFRNDGSGAYTHDAEALPVVPGECEGAVLLDVESDGDLDLFLSGAVASEDPSALDEVLLLNGPAGFSDASERLPAGLCCESGRALSADLDGDRDQDLLVAADFPRLVVQQDHAYFADATPLRAIEQKDWYLGEVPTALVLGDLDGDGAADGARARGGKLELLRNDGKGELAAQAIYTHPTGGGQLTQWQLALPDVDGDGDLDLYSAGSSQDVWINGNSGFEKLPGALPTSSAPDLAEFFDADGDGDLDLASARDALELLINDGDGKFTKLASFPAHGACEAVAVGDFDADGDADVVARLALTTGALYRNEPGEVWTLTLGLDVFLGASDLDAGDVDGDGLLDVLASMPNSTKPFVLLGDGTGGFAPGASLPEIGSPRSELVDLDGDGDLDVVSRGLWANLGDGTFASGAPLGFELNQTLQGADWQSPITAAVGDLDADGDLDVLYDRLILFESRMRATTWRSLAGLGRPLVLGVHGEPVTPWVLGWSLGSTSIALPPFGMLQLDPTALRLAGAGLLSDEGVATPSMLVPPNESLLGIELHWQSLVGSPPRLTDRTTTRLLAL